MGKKLQAKEKSLGKHSNTDMSCSVFTTFKPKINLKYYLQVGGVSC